MSDLRQTRDLKNADNCRLCHYARWGTLIGIFVVAAVMVGERMSN